ncbi:MAG: hypothetical protein PUC05_00295 [Firmicutes bacterium]|nr:hypothetical protein [Bacillota bacterium]
MAEKNNVKLRSSKWLIIVLCILIKVMLIPTLVLGICYGFRTNMLYQELRSFDSGQEKIVKEFYGIPESIDVTLIVHRQQKGGLRSSSESEVGFYIHKDDLTDFYDRLNSKWVSTQESLGKITTWNKDYRIIRCFDGDRIWESAFGEKIVIMENAYDKEDDLALVYIHKQGRIDGLKRCGYSNYSYFVQYPRDYYYDI